MKLNEISIQELELLPYTTVAKMYLEENKVTKNTAELFKEVCKLLNLTDEEYVEKIADFFESLTTSKEFILLEDGTWDLKTNHKVKIVIEDIEEDTDPEQNNATQDIDETIDNEEEIISIDDDNFLDDDPTDDLADLTIIDDDE